MYLLGVPPTSFPVKARYAAEGLVVTFSSIATNCFQDAFCHETIDRCSASQTDRTFSWSVVEDVTSAVPNPAGLIFHIARCGSTLVSQLLRQHTPIVVYSEPPALNDVLLRDRKHTADQELLAIRFIVGLLGLHAAQPFVLKLRSWNTLKSDVLLGTLPRTPWLFVVRDPLEVAVSVLERPPTWLRARHWSENPFAAFVPELQNDASEEAYVAAMLKAFFESALRAQNGMGLLVNYADLPWAVWDDVSSHFSLHLTGEDILRMRDVAPCYSKAAFGLCQPFVTDSQMKQSRASAHLKHCIDALARPAFDRLQRLFDKRTRTK